MTLIVPSVSGTRSWLKWDLEHGAELKENGVKWGEAAKGHGHGGTPEPHVPRALPGLKKVWGKDRTAEYMSRDLHAEGEWTTDPTKARYGTVIFNKQGQVLLREPKGHFSGMTWTFAKGHTDPNEHPVETARRETLEGAPAARRRLHRGRPRPQFRQRFRPGHLLCERGRQVHRAPRQHACHRLHGPRRRYRFR